jgi:hypothetical protein
MTRTRAARTKSPKRPPARRKSAARRVPPRHPVVERLAELGVLRLVLLGLALTCLVLMPPAGAAVGYSGWPLVTTVLVPVLAPLVFMVLLLDALMSAVFLADQRGPARARYARILAVDLVAAGLLLVFWLPFYLALGG